ncbi:MAG: 3,4-dihydroxy-2-butanone-4-phosphate synthase [Phycisphaerales bacterium]|jgi:3,4-dihydroxy 2-butanone 4-phosphate synthase/GTP cyclohydrolase II|nr:3,4-dihydroxy-2-butanone-4-phosphate synthase [Phycisphaerales bacterium]
MQPPFSPIEDVLADLRAGRMVVLTDDERRENEGDLILPAQFVTPDAITFMLKEAKGYLCLSLTEGDCDRLDLVPQAAINTSVRGTPFTVSIDGHPRHGFTTGVSSKERARTVLMAIDPATGPDDFVRPGHINPLRSRDGGVLVRTGQTEGSIDLCRLAGLTPAALIIEIMKDDGEMARVPDLEHFCRTHGLKMCSVAQIIEHRLARESLIRRVELGPGAHVDTPHGRFDLIAFDSVVDPQPHLVLSVGGVGLPLPDGSVREEVDPVLVRVHRRDVLGDIFGDVAHASGGGASGGGRSSASVLHASMARVQKEGRGAIVYLRPEGTGDGLSGRLTAIRRDLFDSGADRPDLVNPRGVAGNAMPMHLREVGIGGQVLRQLGLRKLRLLTTSPKNYPALEGFGLEIAEQIAIDA